MADIEDITDEIIIDSSDALDTVQIETAEFHAAASSSLSIVADIAQKGNALLEHFQNIRYIIASIIPDYLITPKHALVFISLRFHRLHPKYLEEKLIKVTACSYTHKILLCYVDLPDYELGLHQVNNVAFKYAFSLMLSWSPSESGKIIETFKTIIEKPPESIQGKLSKKLQQRVSDILTSVGSINKNDVVALMHEFGSFRELLTASREEFINLPGIGSKKLNKLWNVFHGAYHEPF